MIIFLPTFLLITFSVSLAFIFSLSFSRYIYINILQYWYIFSYSPSFLTFSFPPFSFTVSFQFTFLYWYCFCLRGTVIEIIVVSSPRRCWSTDEVCRGADKEGPTTCVRRQLTPSLDRSRGKVKKDYGLSRGTKPNHLTGERTQLNRRGIF